MPAGSYSFWVQDFNAEMTQTPEAATCLLLIAGALSLALIRDVQGLNRARE
jgi:hypothetical protein